MNPITATYVAMIMDEDIKVDDVAIVSYNFSLDDYGFVMIPWHTFACMATSLGIDYINEQCGISNVTSDTNLNNVLNDKTHKMKVGYILK